MPRHSMSTLEKIVFANQAASLSDEEWADMNTARNRIRELKKRAKKPAPKKSKTDSQP